MVRYIKAIEGTKRPLQKILHRLSMKERGQEIGKEKGNIELQNYEFIYF